jgi:hypothetical protein
LGGYDTSGTAIGLQVVGRIAYVADWHAGLQLIDVSEPDSPQHLGGILTGGYAQGVQVKGSIAYVADGNAGLQIIDVSNPLSPVRLGGYDTRGWASGVQVVGDTAYVADGVAGLQVIDVSNPAYPVLEGGVATGFGVWSVQIVGDIAYIAGGLSGLQTFKVRMGSPQLLKLQLPAPLPFPGKPLTGWATTTSRLPLAFSVVSGSASVVNGQLTITGLGPVTLHAEQAGDALYLPASAQWTVTVIPPNLGVRLTGGSVELAWAAGLDGLKLQVRKTLGPDSAWQDVPDPVVEADGEARVSTAINGTQAFFRLIQP